MSMGGPAALSGALLARKGSANPTGYAPVRAQDMPDVNVRGKTAANADTAAATPVGRTAAPQRQPGERPWLADSAPSGAAGARTRVSVRLDRERLLKLKLTAAHLDRSLQAVIAEALDRYIEHVAPEVLHKSCACLGITRASAPAADGAPSD